MKALFEVTSSHETSLPPMECNDGSGYQLHFVEDGILKGGYSCVSRAPLPHTLTVEVEASEKVLDRMANDDMFFYLCDVEEVEDAKYTKA